jgi:hypothetical protein
MKQMHYVPTKTEMQFIRNERDLAGFARNYAKRVERVWDAHIAPKVFEKQVDERGNQFTVVTHAHTGLVLDVQN